MMTTCRVEFRQLSICFSHSNMIQRWLASILDYQPCGLARLHHRHTWRERWLGRSRLASDHSFELYHL